MTKRVIALAVAVAASAAVIAPATEASVFLPMRDGKIYAKRYVREVGIERGANTYSLDSCYRVSNAAVGCRFTHYYNDTDCSGLVRIRLTSSTKYNSKVYGIRCD